jgi:hypothetical protein
VADRREWTIAKWVIGLGIAFFVLRALVTGWTTMNARPVVWAPRPAFVVGSALLTWLMYALLVAAWRMMLLGWGERLRPIDAARIWTVSSLGKYLPGKVWAIAGMAVMAQRAGVAAWAATASAVMLQALAVGSAAIVIGATGVAVLEAEYPGVRPILLGLIAASVVGMGLLMWPTLVRALLRLVRVQAPVRTTPGAGAVLFGAASNVTAWCGYGVALWLLAAGLFDAPGLTLLRAVGAFTASYLAGLLFLPAPAGIGIREAVFVLMLEGAIGREPAAALAHASRLMLTITELGAAAPFLLFFREQMRAES